MNNRIRRSGNAARSVSRAALIGALYVVLSYISTLVGLSSGVIQLRLSEALMILPVLMPEAIVGLTLGCFISNMLSGCLFLDIIFGTLATLIGAVGAYLLRRLPEGIIWLAALPNVISNALIIPLLLITVYGAEGAYPLIVLSVAIGETVTSLLLGGALYYRMKNINFK